MERRFARLAAFSSEFDLFTTSEVVDACKKLGIDLPSNRLFLLDIVRFGNLSLPITSRPLLMARFMHIARRRKYHHVHLAMEPRRLTNMYSHFSNVLPPFSITVADSTMSFDANTLSTCVGSATFVDCLSDTIREEIMRRTPELSPWPMLRVSPCSFTDYSRVEFASDRDIDVALISRLVPGKGHPLLLKALRLINDSLNVHVCGVGPLRLASNGVQVYETSNPFSVLARTKIFVSLQDVENYPSQALLEAMASGCAIIATDVGETRKLLDETCAILIPSGDAHALKSAIEYLLQQPGVRVAKGTSARRRVLAEHTVERFASYMLGEIRSVQLEFESPL